MADLASNRSSKVHFQCAPVRLPCTGGVYGLLSGYIDVISGAPDQTHLLGEWVDLKNTGDSAVWLSTLHLAHVEYDAHGRPHDLQAIYWNGPAAASLQPGQTVRVHTGKASAVLQMLREDMLGVDHHAYADRASLVLNNKEGDTLTVLWKSEGKWYKEDAASYEPLPAEGEVLVRSGQKLVSTAASAMLRLLQRL